jgi:hypothetical protein
LPSRVFSKKKPSILSCYKIANALQIDIEELIEVETNKGCGCECLVKEKE